MDVIAFVVGMLFSYWSFGKHNNLSWLFIIFFTSAYSSEKSFNALYDIADDEVSFELYKDHNKDVKNYSDYLKIHRDARPTAYKTFRSSYDALIRALALQILPITLAPAVLFWSHWYVYFLGVVVTMACLIAYEIYKNGIRPGFYQRIIVFTAMSTFYKSKVKQPIK